MPKPNLEILAYDPSPLGTLCLRRREMLSRPGTFVTEVTLNHEFLMSSLHTDSERALAKTAIDLHSGDNLSVLVGGLGLGYTAHAALQSTNVASVEVVELLPQVASWLSDGLVPLSSELNDDPRFSVTLGDVYGILMDAPNKSYDVIMIDVDHSPDERLGDESHSFYEERGLKAARDHLNENGVLAVWSYAENSPFSEALRNQFSNVKVESVTYQNQLVHEACTDWLFYGVKE